MRLRSSAAFVPIVAVAVACGTSGSSPGSPTPAQDPTEPSQAASNPGVPGPVDGSAGKDAGGGGDAFADAAPPTAASCLGTLLPKTAISAFGLDYDQFHPTMNPSCAGTHHQNVTAIEKLVFLGDSVTLGTPPTAPDQIYAYQLWASLTAKFGTLEVQNCAQWGATTVDLLGGMNEIGTCFPSGVEPKKTLVVMTVGSNNLQDWALAKPTVPDAIASADVAAGQLRAAITWLKDPARFPAGSYVAFADAYEYTDGTGDLASCFAAQFTGLSGNLAYIYPAIVHLEEQFMKVAVDTGSDFMFLYEHFCGHGYHATDPAAPCFRPPGADLWFDVSCAHPNPTGHTQLAQLFYDVIVP